MRARKKSELKTAIRDQARRKVGVPKYDATTQAHYHEEVEKGLQNLRKISSEGGDPRGKKAKNELLYLLNNYSPKYDTRIEQLIDLWRRSGDPSYDPSIRTKLRQARREHMSKSNPL